MSKNHAFGTALIVCAMSTLMLASCSDRPTEPQVRPQVTAPSFTKEKDPNKQRAALLTNVPVSGVIEGGGTFTGTFTATHIAMDPATRQLTLSGILNGVATRASGEVVNVVDAAFSAPMSLSKDAAASAQIVRPASMQAVCDILLLVLGPLHLDLLGLTIDLSQVILDINAVSGGGNLLGNLLCAIVGLLDGVALIAQISQLLDIVNNILAGLGGNPGVGGAAWITPGMHSRSLPAFST